MRKIFNRMERDFIEFLNLLHQRQLIVISLKRQVFHLEVENSIEFILSKHLKKNEECFRLEKEKIERK